MYDYTKLTDNDTLCCAVSLRLYKIDIEVFIWLKYTKNKTVYIVMSDK